MDSIEDANERLEQGVGPRPSKARTAYRKRKKSIQVRRDLCSTERRGGGGGVASRFGRRSVGRWPRPCVEWEPDCDCER
jgi:hypothetical protein